MNNATNIEKLRFVFEGGKRIAPFAPVLLGVVGSGNLEVMAEPSTREDFIVGVETSAKGFEEIWSAVLQDFHQQHQQAGLRISINDMGATPAVVGLRLRQIMAQLRESA